MVQTQKTFFPWRPEYCVQHAGIDTQHQKLVALTNELYTAMAEGHGRTAMAHTLSGLVDYTKSHFAYEEQQMQLAGYPDAKQHKEQHLKLLQQVESYVKAWNGSQAVGPVELAAFLKDWLLHHIGGTDRPLAAYLAARK